MRIIAHMAFGLAFLISANIAAALDLSTLHGKVKIVEHFADYKVKVVNNFPDLNVKAVSSFPDDCGEWQFVESFPDFTVEFVEHFPDFTIKYVEHFPGIP